ncbi:response regulator [Spirochaeta africana]|uniref:Response regulator with CheY-like receiver, AAA-type ATPase, and DNA-binding domains n=1 Tax=Spirochaeta africana (strain ATCC 700263 / DSM 8902 / Z-7692) TaxID=889378 RepID=H9UJY8_SPIAZ|nr:response regulator [Spirochaeta africana]AFG37831.1 response regulator with CheY-like receiver, AAA-type ATPase, and DNA-binding domains [Spirochaeta africana DSM 8902]
MAKILIIEDSRAQQALLARFLSDKKHEVTTAGDGEQGLEQLKSGRFDAVITDIVLPRMDGIELIREIRASCDYPLVIIAISGGSTHAVQSHLETARIAGADGALAKPFQRTALQQLLQDLLRKNAASGGPGNPAG